jgi:hypothetical protein
VFWIALPKIQSTYSTELDNCDEGLAGDRDLNGISMASPARRRPPGVDQVDLSEYFGDAWERVRTD